MVLNSLIDFCFDGEGKYITVNKYGACWVKNIKDNVMSQQTTNKGCSCLSTS